MARPLRLPFPLALALRYLRSTRRDAFVSFLSLTAAGGIALGVAALILALAALTGFQDLLRGEILARTPELQITLPAGVDSEPVVAAVQRLDGVRSASTLVRGRGWVVGAPSIRPVEIVGYEGTPPQSIFPGRRGGGDGLYLGDRLAATWGLAAGEVVEVASSRPTLSPVGPQPRVRRLALAGTFHTGRTEEVDRAAVPIAEARHLLGRRETYVEVATGDLDRALAVAPRLVALLAELGVDGRVESWRDLNRPLFFALRLEKSVMFVAVFLIVVVAALALISGISLLVSKKRPEIGMLGAMGASPGLVWRSFMILGGLLALAGIAVGASLGVAGALTLDRYQLLRLPNDVYFVDHVPFAVHWSDVGVVVACTLTLALLCASYAARRAAGLTPIEALRR